MLIKFCRIIDKLNEWTGRAAAWLILPMSLLVAYDVMLRYAFNSPTIWAWDINVQLLGAMVALGGGYALLHDSHVGVDVISTTLTKRKQIILRLITFILFFISMGVLVFLGITQAWISLRTMEVDYTFFAPPIYPLKVLIAAGFLFLFLEAISKFIGYIIAYRQGEGE